MKDAIVISGMRFNARHGVWPRERETLQPFEVSLRMELATQPAARADDLTLTVDYCAAQKAVKAVMEARSCKLIETLAEEIARTILAGFPMVTAVEVELNKPMPPVDFTMHGVAVRIRRERPAADA